MLAKKNKPGESGAGQWPELPKYFPRCLFEENHLIFLYPAPALSCPTLLKCFLKGVSKNTYEIHIKISKNVLFWTVFKANFSFRQF